MLASFRELCLPRDAEVVEIECLFGVVLAYGKLS